jgi:hypothetical protein
MRYFHTQSRAGCHDPFLCNCLYIYVSQSESEECAWKILKDDAVFHKAIGDYKNVVAHFFIFKKESWLPTLLHNLVGIDHCRDVAEFAKGQGAIHILENDYFNTVLDQDIDNFLVKLVLYCYQALKEIDEFIYDHRS